LLLIADDTSVEDGATELKRLKVSMYAYSCGSRIARYSTRSAGQQDAPSSYIEKTNRDKVEDIINGI